MNINFKKALFGDGRNKRPPVLLAVTPPRTGERTLLGVENLLQSIAVPEPFSLELAADMDGVSLMARCQEDQVVQRPDRRPLSPGPHPPGAGGRGPHLRPPGRAGLGNDAAGPTVPSTCRLRTFRDDDLLDPGSDPLIALMGALSELEEGERVLCRLLLRSLGPDWSQAHQARAHKAGRPREPGAVLHLPDQAPATGRRDHGGAGRGGFGRPQGLPVGPGRRVPQGGVAGRRFCPGRQSSRGGAGGAGSRFATGSTTRC